MTFWTRAKLISPLLARLLARHPHARRPLTDDEIVKSVAGLSHFEVDTLGWKTDWDGVPVDTMQLYLVACRCDFESRPNMKRVEEYLRSCPSFKYLQCDAQWNIRWMPMLIRWRQTYKLIPLQPDSAVIAKLAKRLAPLLQIKKAA